MVIGYSLANLFEIALGISLGISLNEPPIALIHPKNPSMIPKTKFFPPKLQSETVIRQVLLAKISNIPAGSIIAVVAPAGWGKTTTVIQWIEQNPETAVWYSIDDYDNDPDFFWRGLIGAFKSYNHNLGGEALSLLVNESEYQLRLVVSALINDLLEYEYDLEPNQCVDVVIDDFHCITDPVIVSTFSYFLTHLPSQFRFFLTSRSNPNLDLEHSRYHEISTEDLRFAESESFDLLNHIAPEIKAIDQMRQLHQKIDGWPIGLHFLAYSDADHQHQRDPKPIESKPDSTLGFGKLDFQAAIENYTEQELLATLNAENRHALLTISLLPRFNHELIAVVLQNTNTNFISQWKRFSFQILPLDNQSYWYRLHHLFQEILSNIAARHREINSIEARSRAAKWFEANGYRQEAFELYLKASDYAKALANFEKVALEMGLRSELKRLNYWLKQFPHPFVLESPFLLSTEALIKATELNTEEAQYYLGIAEKLLDQNTAAEKASAAYNNQLSNYYMARSLCALFQDNLPEAKIYADKIRELVRQAQVEEIRLAAGHIMIGYVLYLEGDLGELVDLYASWYNLWCELKLAFILSRAVFLQAHCLTRQGACQKAIQIGEKTVSWYRQNEIGDELSLSILTFSNAWPLIETNQLDLAYEMIRPHINYREKFLGTGFFFVFFCHLELSYHHARGDYAACETLLNQLALFPNNLISLSGIPSPAGYRALLAIETSDFDTVRQWLQSDEGVLDKKHYRFEFTQLIYIRCLLALNMEAGVCVSWLERLIPKAESAGRLDSVIKAHLLLVLYYQQQSSSSNTSADQARAKWHCQKAFEIGAGHDFFMVYILFFGQALIPMLDLAQRHHITPLLVKKLQRYFAGQGESEAPIALASLTRREREVLQLIKDGMRNKQIASSLNISIHTVKNHVRNILEKLGVSTRVQAISLLDH